VTKVLKEEQFFIDHFNDKWSYLLNKTAEGSENMPISLQVIGYPSEDEKILGIMKQIELKLNYNVQMPNSMRDSLYTIITRTE